MIKHVWSASARKAAAPVAASVKECSALTCALLHLALWSQVRSMALFGSGKYDGKVWDKDAKDDVAASYDPSQPWSDNNFDPFKKDANGNACDPSGYYPGKLKLKLLNIASCHCAAV